MDTSLKLQVTTASIKKKRKVDLKAIRLLSCTSALCTLVKGWYDIYIDFLGHLDIGNAAFVCAARCVTSSVSPLLHHFARDYINKNNAPPWLSTGSFKIAKTVLAFLVSRFLIRVPL